MLCVNSNPYWNLWRVWSESANAWMRMQTGGQISAQSSYWLIELVFGGLMLMFYFRFGRGGNGPEA